LYLSEFVITDVNAFSKKIDKKMNYLMLLAVIFASNAEICLQNIGADTSYLLYCGANITHIPQLQLCWFANGDTGS
jgi:hypothetical protein